MEKYSVTLIQQGFVCLFVLLWSFSQAQQKSCETGLQGACVLHFGGVSFVRTILERANQCMSLFFAEAASRVAIIIFSFLSFLYLELGTVELTFQSDSS